MSKMLPSEQSVEQTIVEFDINKFPSMSTILWIKTFLIKKLPVELVELVLDHAEYWPHTTTIKPRLGLVRTPVKWRGTSSNILSPSWPSPESEAMQEVLGFTLYSPLLASESSLTRAATLKKGLRRLVRKDPEICLPLRGQHPARMIVFEAFSQRHDLQTGKFCDVGIIREDDELLEQDAPAAETQRRNSSVFSAFRSNTKPSKPDKTHHLVAQRECWFSPGAKAEGKYVIKWRHDEDLEDGIKKYNDEKVLPTTTDFTRKLKVGDSIGLWAPIDPIWILPQALQLQPSKYIQRLKSGRTYANNKTCSLSFLNAPPSPLGFEVSIRFHSPVSLNSLGVYVNTIEIIYQAVQNGWEETFDRASGHAYGVEMLAVGTAPAPIANRLQNCHVILGLLQVIYIMVARNRFCMTLAQLFLQKEEIGGLSIVKSGSSDVMRNSGLSNDSLSTFSNGRLGTPGHIVDPDDPSFTITYSYDGETLASEEVFTSVLDGLTSSTVFDNQHPCNAFYAVSITSKLVFGVLTTRSETFPLSYFYVRKLFILLALEMVARDKYGEVEFELIYDGEKIGEGFVRLTPVLGNGTSGVASERRSIKGRGDLCARSIYRWCRKVDAVSREINDLLAN